MNLDKMSTSNKLFRLARCFAIAYLLVLFLMTFLETWLVYPAPSPDSGLWNPTGYAHQDVYFQSADNTKLHGWLFEHASAKRVILYCHGNGEDISSHAALMDRLRKELDATLLVFDYRGYGRSEGRPKESGVIADGMAAHRWLAEHAGVAPSEVVLMGRSLGGGVAVASAAELGAKALVLQSTFARMVDTAAQLYPWLPVRWVMSNRYDSLARAEDYHGPVLQSHGTDDGMIPIAEGRRLFDAFDSAHKQWIEIPAGGHNAPQPTGYYLQLREFLDLRA